MKYKGFVFFLVGCLIFSSSFPARSQSGSGVPGYMRIPIATFNDDGTLMIGTGFLPHKHLPYSNFSSDALTVFFNLTFLSFVEVDLRVTRKLNVPSGAHHVVDRVPTIRFRILKEKKWMPAVAIGFHDVITSFEDGTARHFGASYVVATRNFHLKKLHLVIGTTAGWGANELIWKNDEFVGPFGGISLSLDHLEWMQLLCDYDGATINTGVRFTCFKRLFLTAGTMNFDSFAGTVSYRINLIK
ncbi:MAG: YjbH domain-containing protein [Bacteroidales bacterium]|nr:YjbH domain-containing protein [Bacteroidales bacterium]